MIQAADLTERVTFTRTAAQKDEKGNQVGMPLDLFTTWASVQSLAGRQNYLTGEISTDKDYKIRIRYRYDHQLTENDGATHKGRKLQLVSVVNVNEANEELQIIAKETT